MSSVQVWKDGDSSAPKFPAEFDVIKKAVLQVTDIKTNRNKYYAIELHSAKNKYRVFTHYGRTDDLDSNPNAGMRESRYCGSLSEAEALYGKIYSEKTSPRKGYKEINLASSKIGSSKSVGKSSGELDQKTIEKLAEKAPPAKRPAFVLEPSIQDLVGYLYTEATNALTSTLNVSITANGIETPLGVLTLGQIEKGQVVLDNLIAATQKTRKNKAEIETLSGDFYTLIPHRLGRSRTAIEDSVIDSAAKCIEKNDTLQLMRDMLNVNGDPSVLLDSEIEGKYKALNCEITSLPPTEAKKIISYVESSTRRKGLVKVKNVWAIKRPVEREEFNGTVGNEKLLFHGSAVKNWVGILSRGLLMPKVVVTLGVTRTDAGWLGSGIYFGSEACTTLTYAHPGKRATRFMTVANVALGKVKEYTKITYGLSSPPDGYNSCHGVAGSQFSDNELVIYDSKQQRLEYLVEYSGSRY